MRLLKEIMHVMETVYLIDLDDAKKLLPTGFTPHSFLRKGIMQLGSLRYSDLIFEGQSLGPCTDVYFAIAVKWEGKLCGYCIAFYNNSERVIEEVNKNWFFSKKFADIEWERTKRKLAIRVALDEKLILDHDTTTLIRIFVLPIQQRVRRALTLSGNTVYAFKNIFGKRCGIFALSTVRAQGELDWFNNLRKNKIYSIQWFNDELRITDSVPVAKQVSDQLEPLLDTS